MSQSIIEDDNTQSPQPDSKWNPAPFRGWQGISACLRVFQACARLCSRAFFCWNMCFRGNFFGGASAKDKGHRGHREWFFCSSGFQIIQGRGEGASRPSFSPFLSLFCPALIEFPSLDCHAPSVPRRPRPNHTFLPAPVRSEPRQLRQALWRSTGLWSGGQNTKATAGDSQAPPSTNASTGHLNDWSTGCGCRGWWKMAAGTPAPTDTFPPSPRRSRPTWLRRSENVGSLVLRHPVPLYFYWKCPISLAQIYLLAPAFL